MEENNVYQSELEKTFEKAAAHLGGIVSTLSNDKLLYFYARYKQALEGECTTAKPSLFNASGRKKWEAWKLLGSMGKTQAMEEYVEALQDADPTWTVENTKNVGQGWARVSRMPKPPEEKTEGADEAFIEAVREGDVEKMRQMSILDYISFDFGEGMTALHWAADRGRTKVAEILLSEGFDVNALDDCGQTPLHYACSCGHLEMVSLLLDHKADSAIKDEDGCTPLDAASEDSIKSIFDRFK